MIDVSHVILEEASPGSLARGHDYFVEGRVTEVEDDGRRVTAVVAGTEPYTVGFDDQDLWCSCPFAADGNVCKHLVALALAVLPLEDEPPTLPGAPGEPSPLSHYLAELDREELAALVLELATAVPAVADLLALRLAEQRPDAGALANVVDDVLATRRFLDYSETIEYAADAEQLVQTLDRLAGRPGAGELVAVVQRAVRHVLRVGRRADDSSGAIGTLLDRLLDAHLNSCRAGCPEPVATARWLARITVDETDFAAVDIVAYADALGADGVAAYRAAITTRAAKDPDAWWIRPALARLAVLDRDVDAIVAQVGGGFPAVRSYRDVAEAMLEIDRPDLALHWARAGLERPVSWQAVELYDLAARLTEEQDGPTATVELRWRQLQAMPTADSYRALLGTGSRAGREDLREEARAVLADRSPQGLVEVLLRDGELDRAWALATDPDGAGASEHVLVELVRRRATTHPLEAAPYLAAFAEKEIRGANRRAYRDATRWLKDLRAAYTRAGCPQEWDRYMVDLRAEHRRRPALLDELARARL